MSDNKKQGMYIPYEVQHGNLSPNARILYAVLRTYSSFDDKGVWASRKTLGEKVWPARPLTEQRITQLINELRKAGFICFNGYKKIHKGRSMRLIKNLLKNPKKEQKNKLVTNNILLGDGGVTNNILLASYIKNINNIYTPCFSKSKNGDKSITQEIPRDKNIPASYYRFAAKIQKEQIERYPNQFKQYFPNPSKNKPSKLSTLANQISEGAKELDKLVRLDGWDWCEDVKPAIEWAIQDKQFWSLQVLSLAMIRKKSESNGKTKFANLFLSWEEHHNLIQVKKQRDKEKEKNYREWKRRYRDDPNNPSRKILKKGPDGRAIAVWEN